MRAPRQGRTTSAPPAEDGDQRRPATPAEVRALAHPLRLRIIRLAGEEGITNRELAAELGVNSGTSLYHVRQLVDAGFLRVDEARRGARNSTEKPYCSTGKSWRLDVTDPADRGRMELAVLDALRAERSQDDPSSSLASIRLAVRLRAADRDELTAQLKALVAEFRRRDTPEAAPYGLYVSLHSRRPRRPRAGVR